MLAKEHVLAVYRELLGRVPSDEEVEHQVKTLDGLDALLRVVLESDEYATHLRNERTRSAHSRAFVNVFHPGLAAWGLPPGTRSDDGTAIVGREGWLFLCGGTNANLGQYVGAIEMAPGWLDEWREVIRRRDADLRQLGVASALLVVPDKLAVYEDYYPEELTRVGPRPVERLLGANDLPILYPLADLRAAAASEEEVYLRTDTHLTFRGNELLFSSVREAMQIDQAPDFTNLPFNSYPILGDLGIKFDPEIVSIVSEPGSLHCAEIVEDNRPEVEAVNGHIGTRRVFRNKAASDPRVAVIFGDSFGFAAPYYQGLAWFLAQVFQEVHFVWVPFGWDPDYVRQVGAEAVLIQGAERFVARVPRGRVDVSRLAEETLQRKKPVGVERIFD